MRYSYLIPVTLSIVFMTLGGCSQIGGTTSDDGTGASAEPTADEREAEQSAKQRLNETIAAIPADSPMSRLRAGMTESEVYAIMGREDLKTRYETGKRWIPYYGRWANDTRRHSLFYNGQGHVIMSRNRYTGQYHLIEAVYDPEYAAY